MDGCTDTNKSWWRHQMETFSALLAICAGNSPVPSEFPAQRPVTRSFRVFFDLRPEYNNRGTGDLRRYRVHDDVIVMWCNNDQVSKVTMVTQPMVSSVPLIHQFFKGWSPSISCSYLTDVAAISPVFQNHQNTGYPYDITFIFQRCHRSLAMVTFVKYECDLKNLTSTFVRSKIYLTEKLMNGTLVTPTLVVLVRKHQQQQRRLTWLHRNLTVITLTTLYIRSYTST